MLFEILNLPRQPSCLVKMSHNQIIGRKSSFRFNFKNFIFKHESATPGSIKA